MKKTILYIGGVLNIILAVFHMLFWELLNWGEELPKLSAMNRGVLQIANIIIIFTILYFAAMSFIIAKHNKSSLYSNSIIILIAGFYSIRLFLGYPFFGFNHEELIIWIVCLVIIAGYLATLFMKEEAE